MLRADVVVPAVLALVAFVAVKLGWPDENWAVVLVGVAFVWVVAAVAWAMIRARPRSSALPSVPRRDTSAGSAVGVVSGGVGVNYGGTVNIHNNNPVPAPTRIPVKHREDLLLGLLADIGSGAIKGERFTAYDVSAMGNSRAIQIDDDTGGTASYDAALSDLQRLADEGYIEVDRRGQSLEFTVLPAAYEYREES